MDKLCHNCGSEIRERSRFCANCGADLELQAHFPTRTPPPPAPSNYGSLRILSSLMEFFGWAVILLGWFIALAFSALLREATANFISGFKNLFVFSTAIFGGIFTIFGLGSIAASQMIKVILDIREDVHGIRQKDQ